MAILGLRADIPLKFLRDLLSRASEALRARLISMASPELQGSIRDILARITEEVSDKVSRQQSEAQRIVLEMNTRGELNEAAVSRYAFAGQREEVVAALALMNGCKFELIDRIFDSPEPEALLVPAMGAGFRWGATRAILKMKLGPMASEADLGHMHDAYAQMTIPTARRTLRFWQVRHTVKV